MCNLLQVTPPNADYTVDEAEADAVKWPLSP